jgi:peptide/nickel transport system permease protein
MSGGDLRALAPDTLAPATRRGTGAVPGLPGDEDRPLDEKVQPGPDARVPARSHSAWRRFAAHRLALASLILLSILLALAVFADLLPLQNPTDPGPVLVSDAPISARHWLGTDGDGLDIFSRLIYGMRPTFAVGLIGMAITTLLGLLFGLLAGYCGGWVDALLARLADLLFAFPSFLLAFLIVGMAGPQEAQVAGGAGPLILITIVFALLGWPGLLRLVRALALSLKEQPYVEAARAVGVPTRQILRRHLLPAMWGLVLVQASFGVAGYMGAEATLSVLGLGMQRPTPDLGLMMSDGFDELFANPVEALAPSLLLTLNHRGARLRGRRATRRQRPPWPSMNQSARHLLIMYLDHALRGGPPSFAEFGELLRMAALNAAHSAN